MFGGGSAGDNEKKAAALRKNSDSLEQEWKQWKRPDDEELER